jgi:hypothetical protein
VLSVYKNKFGNPTENIKNSVGFFVLEMKKVKKGG